MKPYSLGLILIGILLWIGTQVFTNAQQVEGFTTRNVNLNFCPKWAPQIQTAKGNTDCCEGTLLDGKCSAKTFCTLSPSYNGIPSCLDAWKQYFIEQSQKQCPPTMPNYFEDVKLERGQKGCSQSASKEDGRNPVNSALPSCRIYPTERENREQSDSCFVEKEKLKVQCPAYPAYRNSIEKVSTVGGKFGSFVCVYTNTIGDKRSCNDEKSLIAMWDRENPNWRTDRNRFAQLNNVSCRTFTDRETERKRVEDLKRQVEEEKRKREEQANRFRSFFSSWRTRMQKASEDAKRKTDQQQQDVARQMREMQERLKR